MEYNWILTSSAGYLLLLRGLHLFSIILWLGLSFQNTQNLKKVALGSAVFCIITGVGLFRITSIDLHTSWGYSIVIGSILSLLMLLNQILNSIFNRETAVLNMSLGLVVIFLMTLGAHTNIQISPSSSLYLVVGICLLPNLIFEVLSLLPKFNKFFRQPLYLIIIPPCLVGMTYALLEYLSKKG